jgi:putative hydrolase of the HAD superfamily
MASLVASGPRRPRAVSLDAGGVLLLPDPERVRAALRPLLTEHRAPPGRAATRPGSLRLLLADERLVAAHYAGMAAFDRPAASPVVRSARYRAAYARALGFAGPALPATLAALGACFAEAGLWSVPAPGARLVVGCLAAWGVPVVVVSNTEHGEAAALLARAGIWSHPVPVHPRDPRVPGSPAQGGPPTAPAAPPTAPAAPPVAATPPWRSSGPPVVDSARVGVAKPDPAIFRFALDALDVGPEALLHVGDSSAADVAGATAAGIAALHLDPLDRCPDRRHPHLASLLELLGRFDPAGGSEPG